MWVEFLSDFDFRPAARRRVLISYKKGRVENVTTECAERAIELGKAKQSELGKAKQSSNPERSHDGGNDSSRSWSRPAEAQVSSDAGKSADGGDQGD